MPNIRINYNHKLLNAINSVSAGTDTSVVLYYNEIKETQYIGEVQNALTQWQLFFNTVYSSSQTNNRSGSLSLSFEASSTEPLDITFKIPGGYTLSNSPSKKMAISYLIEYIGKALGFTRSGKNSPMNPVNVVKNYIFLSNVDVTKDGSIRGNGLITYTQLIQDAYKLYGNPKIKNAVIYGCLDVMAPNYSSSATVDSGGCLPRISTGNVSSKLQNDTSYNNRFVFDIASPSGLVQLTYASEYYSVTLGSVQGPYAYEQPLLFSTPPAPEEDTNGGLSSATSSIFTDRLGKKLFTAIAVLSKMYIFDRFGNKLTSDSLDNVVSFNGVNLPNPNNQPINSNIITFGDQQVAAFAMIDNQGFVRVSYASSSLPNFSNGSEIVDCREEGNLYLELTYLESVMGL